MVPALILLCFSRCFRACCCLPVFLSLTAVGVACFRFVVVHHALVSIVSFPSCCSLLSSPWRYHNLSSCDPAAIHWIPEDWRNWYLCAMVGRGFRGSTAQRALRSRASCTRFCRMSKHRFRHLSAGFGFCRASCHKSLGIRIWQLSQMFCVSYIGYVHAKHGTVCARMCASLGLHSAQSGYCSVLTLVLCTGQHPSVSRFCSCCNKAGK